MLDAKRLLDSLLQAGMTESTGARLRNALGPQGLGGQQTGVLGQLAGMLGGERQGTAGGGLGGLLGQVVGGLQRSAGRAGEAIKSNDPVTVGGLGAIVGAVLGGRKGALGGGALALLGSLAVAALQAAQQNRAAAAGAEPSALEQLASDDTALLLVRAMAAAAKADGEIDAQEIARITGKLEEIGADEETRRFVEEELRRPLDLEAIVRAVPGPEVAVEVYAASLLAIEVDTPAERAYLETLASRLQLPRAVVAQVHRAFGIA
jgi:uncharacterized membrane protein YebE (DUF533 family)